MNTPLSDEHANEVKIMFSKIIDQFNRLVYIYIYLDLKNMIIYYEKVFIKIIKIHGKKEECKT